MNGFSAHVCGGVSSASLQTVSGVPVILEERAVSIFKRIIAFKRTYIRSHNGIDNSKIMVMNSIHSFLLGADLLRNIEM
jgi:hypothetical protein